MKTITLEVPDDAAFQVDDPNVGRLSNLRISEFIYTLLSRNETQEPHLTDVELLNVIRLEFSHNPTLLNSLNSGNQRISTYRCRYNQGTLVKGWKPCYLSVPYSDDGRAIVARSGRSIKPDELYRLCKHYDINDPRLIVKEA